MFGTGFWQEEGGIRTPGTSGWREEISSVGGKASR